MSECGNRTCAACGTEIRIARRIYAGEPYCEKCANRFAKSPCPTCAGMTRHPKGRVPLPCTKCRTRNQTCFGCGETPSRRLALRIEDKGYCQNCARKMSEPQPCQLCGTLTVHLAREPKYGVMVKACQSCRGKAQGKRSCSRCRKFRLVGKVTEDGKALCKHCVIDVENGHPGYTCSACGTVGIIVARGLCTRCYHQSLIRRKIEERVPSYSQDWVRNLVVRSIPFFAMRSDGNPAHVLKAIPRYLEFFLRMDEHYKNQHEVSVESLSLLIGGGWQNRYGLICTYLINEGMLPSYDDPEHPETIEYTAQLRILAASKEEWYHGVLAEYHQYLQDIIRRYRFCGWEGQHIRFKQRTARIYLATACKFLEYISTKISSVQWLDQDIINQFMYERPGFYASLPKFIKFLKSKKKVSRKVKITYVKKARSVSEIPTERYFELLDTWSQPQPGKAKEALVGFFALLFAQKPKNIVKVKLTDVSKDANGIYRVKFAKVPLRMPDEVARVIDLYLAERQQAHALLDPENKYLFPGGFVRGSHLNAYTAGIFLRANGVSGKEVFQTSLLHRIRSGLQAPRVLQNATGICGHTAQRYFNLAEVRVQNELNGRKPYGD